MAGEEVSAQDWVTRLADWRPWVHTLSAAAVGGVFGYVFVGVITIAAFGGLVGVVTFGIVAVFVLAVVFGGMSVGFHRGRYGLWLAFVGTVILICMVLGMLILAVRVGAPADPSYAWRTVVGGAATAGGFALLSWPGLVRWIAVTGLAFTLVLVPQWPRDTTPPPITVEPPPPGPVETPEPFPTFAVYEPRVAGYTSFSPPAVLWPDGAHWSLTRVGSDDIAVTMITFQDDEHDPCDLSALYVDPYLGDFPSPVSCNPVTIDGLEGVHERIGHTGGYELSRVIDGQLVRVAAPDTTPRDVVIEALRTAQPMSAEDYQTWRDEVVDPYYP